MQNNVLRNVHRLTQVAALNTAKALRPTTNAERLEQRLVGGVDLQWSVPSNVDSYERTRIVNQLVVNDEFTQGRVPVTDLLSDYFADVVKRGIGEAQDFSLEWLRRRVQFEEIPAATPQRFKEAIESWRKDEFDHTLSSWLLLAERSDYTADVKTSSFVKPNPPNNDMDIDDDATDGQPRHADDADDHPEGHLNHPRDDTDLSAPRGDASREDRPSRRRASASRDGAGDLGTPSGPDTREQVDAELRPDATVDSDRSRSRSGGDRDKSSSLSPPPVDDDAMVLDTRGHLDEQATQPVVEELDESSPRRLRRRSGRRDGLVGGFASASQVTDRSRPSTQADGSEDEEYYKGLSDRDLPLLDDPPTTEPSTSQADHLPADDNDVAMDIITQQAQNTTLGKFVSVIALHFRRSSATGSTAGLQSRSIYSVPAVVCHAKLRPRESHRRIGASRSLPC